MERIIHCKVHADGTPQVRVPLYAGVAGEHNTTALVFEGTNGEFYDGASVARIAFSGGDGTVMSTDLLTVETDESGWSVAYRLPQALTALGGQITARLVLSVIEDGEEVQTAMSGAVVLFLDDSTMEQGTPFWTAVSQMLHRTVSASESAADAAARAAAFAQAAEAAAGTVGEHTMQYKGKATTAQLFVFSKTATVGEVYYNTDEAAFFLWNGTSWSLIGAESGDSGGAFVLTDEDKTDIAELVPLVTAPAEPLFANGVADMTDTANVYVNLETGTLWRYQEATCETTLTDTIALDVNDADNPAYVGQYSNKGTLTANANSFVTPYIDIRKYSGQIALKIKGATCLSASNSPYYCADSCDENRSYMSRVYMSLASQANNYVVNAYCDSVDKVTVDGDTTTLVMDLPRYNATGQKNVSYIRFSMMGDPANTTISIDYQGMKTERMWVDTGIAYAPQVTEADKAAIAQEVAAMVDADLLSVIGDGEVSV